MKLTNLFAISALVILCSVGRAHAADCGGVAGALDVDGAPGLTVVGCGLSGASFEWANADNEFLVSASVSGTSIVLAMDTGFTGGFLSDAYWTVTLASGLTFDPAITKLSDTFADDPESPGGGTEFVSFADAGSTAIFKIIGTDVFYNGFSSYQAEYAITVVPEPEGWMLAVGSLGILALAGRRRSA